MERTREEQILILEILINERTLIISNIENYIADHRWIYETDKAYRKALEDEIENHKIAIQEYKQGLERYGL